MTEDDMQLQRVVGLIEEEEYNVAPAGDAPDFHMEVSDSSIKIDGDPLEFDSGLSRDLKLVRPGPYVPKPEFGGAVDLKTIGHFLKGVLGSYKYTAGVAGAKNTHEIYGGNNMLLPSYTVYGHFDQFIKKVTGFLITSLSIEVSNEWMKLSVKGFAGKDSKTDGVPDPSTLKTVVGIIPLAFYDISMEFDGEVPPGIVSSLKWEITNDMKSDDGIGIGGTYVQRKVAAGKRENTLEFDVTMEPESLKYIEMFEYGQEGADSPQDCILTTVPLKLVMAACENPTEKLTILFPDNLCKVEYAAKGRDAMTLKMSLKSLATTKTELKDGVTEVLSSVVCTLENDMPELVPGGIDMILEPHAAFTASPLSGTHPLEVTFANTSTGANLNYDWDFGDGSPHSTLKNPTHTYATAGAKNPKLTVSNDAGEDVVTKTGYITVT